VIFYLTKVIIIINNVIIMEIQITPRRKSYQPDICRFLSTAKRVHIWEEKNGPVPEGMRIGNTCSVSYCCKLEHMVLHENKNHGRKEWKSIASKILLLEEGQSLTIPEIPHTEVLKMRTAMINHLGKVHIITRNLPGRKGVSVIRVGDYYGSRDEWEKQFPILDKKVGNIRPWQKSSSVWMGQFFNPHSAKEFPKPNKCKIASCVFPVLKNDGDYCFQHKHWFDYPISMTDNKVDFSRMFRASDPHAAYMRGFT